MARKRVNHDTEYPEHTYHVGVPEWMHQDREMPVKASDSDDARKSEYIDRVWKTLTARDHIASAGR